MAKRGVATVAVFAGIWDLTLNPTAALEALDQRHALLMVYASGKAREEQAERILQAYGARELAYFGRWTITELTDTAQGLKRLV